MVAVEMIPGTRTKQEKRKEKSVCGIFGFNFRGPVPARPLAITATVLMVCNDTRGGDSWGYYVPGRDWLNRGLGDIAKHVRPGTLSRHDRVCVHTRKRSMGDVTVKNAHPFKIEAPGKPRIVGAHNGILDNHFELNRTLNRSCTVDSQQIFWHLAEGRDLSEIEGYGAIWYVAEGDDSEYLGRFNGGSLAVARLKCGELWQGVVWSSTENHLQMALEAAGWDKLGEFLQIDDKKLYRAKEGELWVTGQEIGIRKAVIGFTSSGYTSWKGGMGSHVHTPTPLPGYHKPFRKPRQTVDFSRTAAGTCKGCTMQGQLCSKCGLCTGYNYYCCTCDEDADIKEFVCKTCKSQIFGSAELTQKWFCTSCGGCKPSHCTCHRKKEESIGPSTALAISECGAVRCGGCHDWVDATKSSLWCTDCELCEVCCMCYDGEAKIQQMIDEAQDKEDEKDEAAIQAEEEAERMWEEAFDVYLAHQNDAPRTPKTPDAGTDCTDFLYQ